MASVSITAVQFINDRVDPLCYPDLLATEGSEVLSGLDVTVSKSNRFRSWVALNWNGHQGPKKCDNELMRREASRATLWLGALACGGVAGAHWLAYFLAAAHSHDGVHSSAHSHDGADLLASTGHEYWSYFAPIAMAVLIAGLAKSVFNGYRKKSHGAEQRWLSTAAALTLIQVVGFLTLEIGERALFAPGHPLSVLNESVVLWGLAFQVVTAVTATILIRILTRVGEIARGFSRPRAKAGATRVLGLVSQTQLPPAAPATGGPSLRAPPLSL